MAVYQTYVNAMNDKIRKQININNPFVFKHISNLKVRACGGRTGQRTHQEAAGERGPAFLLAASSPTSCLFPSGHQSSEWTRNLAAGVLVATAPVPVPCHCLLSLTNSDLFVAEITSPDEKNSLCYVCSYSNPIIFLMISIINSICEYLHVYFSRALNKI